MDLPTTIRETPVFCVREILHDMVSGGDDGVLLVDCGGSKGRICFHRGRVAWVYSGADGRFLSARLSNVLGLDREELARMLVDCRGTGRPLGEHLVSQGLLSRWRLREVLAAHNREHLRALLEAERTNGSAEFAFESRREHYDLAFTFTAGSLLEGTHAALDLQRAKQLVNEIAATPNIGAAWLTQAGIVVARSDGSDPPAALHALLARWEQAAVGSSRAEVVATLEHSALVLLTRPPGCALVLRTELHHSARSLLSARRARTRFEALWDDGGAS